MNQASRGSPFSTTLTRRSFLGNCTSTTLAFLFSI
ncbi:twin-arginine translocation signal domain-containing protein [Klebsiella michiganensis]